jgi:hypothetical protein
MYFSIFGAVVHPLSFVAATEPGGAPWVIYSWTRSLGKIKNGGIHFPSALTPQQIVREAGVYFN